MLCMQTKILRDTYVSNLAEPHESGQGTIRQPRSQWFGSRDQVELHNTFVEPSRHQGHDQGALQKNDSHTQ